MATTTTAPVKDSPKATARRLYAEGKTRNEIAKVLGVEYRHVYGYTKDMTQNTATGEGPINTGGVKRVFMPDGMPRSEYCRQEYGKGRTRLDIAKELGVTYQIVFAATKKMGSKAKATGIEGEPTVETEEVTFEEDTSTEDVAVEEEETDLSLFPDVNS